MSEVIEMAREMMHQLKSSTKKELGKQQAMEDIHFKIHNFENDVVRKILCSFELMLY